MTPITRVLRRLFLRPVSEALERERRLRETEIRIQHATRTFENAVLRFRRSAEQLQALTEQVVAANRWPPQSKDGR